MENLVETKELIMNVRIKECFDLLYQHQRKLTAGQLEFIRGCKSHFKRNKNLSEKQTKILFDLKKQMI